MPASDYKIRAALDNELLRHANIGLTGLQQNIAHATLLPDTDRDSLLSHLEKLQHRLNTEFPIALANPHMSLSKEMSHVVELLNDWLASFPEPGPGSTIDTKLVKHQIDHHESLLARTMRMYGPR